MALTCHHEGCIGKVRGRGMCAPHYNAWCKANPDVRIHLLTFKLIKGALPGTKIEIMASTGLTPDTVRRAMAKLRAADEVYVADHQPPTSKGTKFQPIYDLRDPDLDKDEQKDHRVLNREREEQRRKTWNGNYHKRKELARVRTTNKAGAGWAAAIMAGM